MNNKFNNFMQKITNSPEGTVAKFVISDVATIKVIVLSENKFAVKVLWFVGESDWDILDDDGVETLYFKKGLCARDSQREKI